MNLAFCALASGSSGNSYIIKSENTALLVDAGISKKRIFEGLGVNGIDPSRVQGILITHEHTDHIRSLGTLVKAEKTFPVYATGQTWKHIEQFVPEERRVAIKQSGSFSIGDIFVTTFPLSHDAAEPVGYCFSSKGKKIALVTDTGCVTDEIYEAIKDADMLAIEANYDEEMLMSGRYPYNVKLRIKREKGHLSNEDAADCICSLLRDRANHGQKDRLHMVLAHLSKENNTPELAELTICNHIKERGSAEDNPAVHVIRHGDGSLMYEL